MRRRGVTFEGSLGRIFVNVGGVYGRPAEGHVEPHGQPPDRVKTGDTPYDF
ncbi:MAG: hypothetical protein ACYTG0_19225 [Planctomycetota bacterium]